MRDSNGSFDSIVEKWLPESLQEVIGFLANLGTIGSILYPLICVAYALFQKQSIEEIPWKDILFPVFILLFVFTLFRYGIKASNYRKIQSIVSRNYYWVLHDYRNAINKLESEYKTNALTEELLHGEVKNYLEISLNYLSDTLSALTGKPVCSCVKLIIGGDVAGVEYEKANIRTFARSHNTNRERSANDVRSGKNGVLVSENTDFISIIQNSKGNGSYFYQGDLEKYEKELHKSGEKYLNTTENWRKYYIGTIVAPIRAANNILFYRTENEDYCIWGFLCVDSLSKSAFPKNKEKDYTHIVKSYASILFNVLSKYQYYLLQLNKSRPWSNSNQNNGNNYQRKNNGAGNRYSKNRKNKRR